MRPTESFTGASMRVNGSAPAAQVKANPKINILRPEPMLIVTRSRAKSSTRKN
jgi:hypothetical protein